MHRLSVLTDGKNAFPEILSCINSAKERIEINMFIWREDNIGCQMAGALLRAADRGVQVEISVDRYAVLLENVEECRKPFFHRRPTLNERIKIWALRVFYPQKGTPKRPEDKNCALADALLAHPNVKVEKHLFKADHSKYYIIDGEILFLGGINIEDKELGQDLQGRVYQDYMAKLVGKECVDDFRRYMQTGENNPAAPYSFGANIRQPRRFDMEKRYLDLIDGAEKELHIVMAYFSPLKPFMRAIVNAWKRGVNVSVMISKNANFQNDTNFKTVKRLMKATGNGISVYVSPKMLHTKLIASEKTVTFGSTNITKKAFAQLCELNLFVQNAPSEFCDGVWESIRRDYALSERLQGYKTIKYNPLVSWIEGILV